MKVSSFSSKAFNAAALLMMLCALSPRGHGQPVILQQPKDQLDVPFEKSAQFQVEAQGKGKLQFRWRKNGILLDLPDAHNSLLNVPSVTPPKAGTYDVVVTDDVGFAVSKPARLTVALPNGQLSDNIFDSNRRPVSDPNGTVAFNNLKATRELNEPLHDGKTGRHSVWMTWIAPGIPGIAHFDTRGSGFDTLLAVYEGNSQPPLNRVASDDDSGGFTTSSLDFKVQPQGLYYIAVDGRLNAAGEIVLSWFFDPSNDFPPVIIEQPKSQSASFGAAVQLTVTYSAPNAEVQWLFNGQPIPGGDPIPGKPGNTLTLTNLVVAQMGVYRARIRTFGQVVREILSNPVKVQVNLLDGSFNADVFTEDKYYDLIDPLTFVVQPRAFALQSDRFEPLNAPARGYSGTQIFSTVGATSEPGEPVHCGVAGGASEWYAIQAEANGTLTIDTIGSAFDTVLAVYTDPADTGTFEGLVSVACNNDIAPGSNLQSAVTFPCTSGTIYFIAVDGVGGATGAATLNYFLNRPPTMTDISNTVISEDTSTGAIPFTINDTETPAASLGISVISSDTLLVPPENISLGGSGSPRTVAVTPAANESGSSTITITVTDANGATASDSFTLTVNAVNDPPTLDSINDLPLNQNAGLQVVNLTGIGSGAPNESQTQSVSASSNNPSLIPTPLVNYSSPASTGSLSFTPAAGGSGSAVVSVTVNDGGSENASVTRLFTVTVTADNQPPTISSISSQFTTEDTPAGPIAFIVADAETPAASLNVTASSSNQSLVPDSNLLLEGTAGTRTITITPALHQTGEVNITVTVVDLNGKNVGHTFLLRINPGNHAPVANPQSLSMLKNGTKPITLTGSDSDGNPLIYSIVASPAKGSLSGTPPALTYTPFLNEGGSDSFQFKVNDGSLESTPALVSITIDEPAPVRFTSFSTNAGQFKLTLAASAGLNYIIERSTDLQTWESVVTLPNPTGTITYFDTIGGTARFYRARQAP